MNEIWRLLLEKGYEIHNKRVLGNPSYTSEETKLRDSIQEQALVCQWIRLNYNIHIYANPVTVVDKNTIKYSGNYAKYAGDCPRWPDGVMVEGIWHFHDLGEVVEEKQYCGGWGWKKYRYSTPEKAIEETILHVLKNLIK